MDSVARTLVTKKASSPRGARTSSAHMGHARTDGWLGGQVHDTFLDVFQKSMHVKMYM